MAAGPLLILTTRQSSIDRTLTLRQQARDLIRHDKLWMFARGIPLYVASVLTVETFAELSEEDYSLPIVVGSLLAHPFYVVSLNVMYARFY